MIRPRFHASLLAACLAAVPGVSAAAELDIVDETQLARFWEVDDAGLPLGWPPGTTQPARACVNLGYSIGRDGGTSNFIVLSTWGEGLASDPAARARLVPFVRSAAATIRSRHFRPLDRARVRALFTRTTFVFSAVPGDDARAVRAHCTVGDLRSFITGEQARALRRGNLNQGLIDRTRQENPWMIPEGPVRHPGWVD